MNDQPLNNNEKRKLFSLFENLKEEAVTTGLNKSLNSDVLLVDGLNLFCRAFASIPTLNENGLHAGGISGSLKSLGYAIRLLNPTRVIVIFDGQGGSVRRKKIFPEYKQHRSNKVRLNRIFENTDTSGGETESEAIGRQLIRLSHYLDVLPVTTIQIDNIEADDVIAYLAVQSFKDSNVSIMSTDKDFYQIVTNDKIKVYSPTKKRIYVQYEILTEYGIHPKNFILYRILDGDTSDNIDGIKGCGIKTIVKAFPFISEDKTYTMNDIFTHAEVNKGKLKIYETILQNKHIVERNYELMQLSDTIISTFSQLDIGELLKKRNKLNRISFIKMINEDLMWNAIPGHQVWIDETFVKLDNYNIL